MTGRLRSGFARWRQLGPRAGTFAAAALALRKVRAPVHRARVRRRPPRATPAEVATALGHRGAREQLRGVVLEALPSVARFEQGLGELDEDTRRELLAVAERAAAHRFDLLGSGPTQLGAQIDWQLDFKSGRRWPLAHISRVPIVYPDESDIKVPWELSRCQHLPVLAAAFRLTGEHSWLEEIGAQLESWIDANPVEFGANWACTMDVGIRAANWVATLALVADVAAPEPWFAATIASLLLHGRFIRHHLEYGPVRGNHYLSDVVGLLVVAALFSAGREGRQWADWACAELVGELDHQVRADGCDHEASIPYHRLVAELFICGIQAAEAIAPQAVSAPHRGHLDRMLDFVADYTRPDSLAPQVGDADDGRFLPLGDYGRVDHRSHLHLFTLAGREYRPSRRHAEYPQGGYWIMRAGPLYVLVRCGDVGVGGLGSHAHNDALSFELAYEGQPLVVDPGSYLYTADPGERNRFRSTAYHSTLQVDGQEQNPLRRDGLFMMEDRRRAEALSWVAAETGAAFTGRHHGYAGLKAPATHTRTIEVDGPSSALRIMDTITSAGPHDLQWTFPLAPSTAEADGQRATATFPTGVQLEIEAPGLDFSIEPGWLSPSYGRRAEVPFVRARRRSTPGEDVTEVTLRVVAAEPIGSRRA